MPNIRIMNWNIEQLSKDKIKIAGMAEAIAHVVVDNDIDILFIVELKSSKTNSILNKLMTAMNSWAKVKNGNPTDDYTTAIRSIETGTDVYAAIIKNPTNTVPILRMAVRKATSELPEEAEPPIIWRNIMSDEDYEYRFETATNTNSVLFGNSGQPVILERGFPLVSIFATNDRSRKARGVERFIGQPIASREGFSEGLGYRLPGMAMFQITGANNKKYLIPFVVCHFIADDDFAPAQIRQYVGLHITQIYNAIMDESDQKWNAISLDNVPTRVENIVFTGDFNVDFLDHNNNNNNNANKAYKKLVVETANSGTHNGKTYSISAQQNLAVPNVEPQPLDSTLDLQLHTGVTKEATHLKPHPQSDLLLPMFSNSSDQRDRCFDNFFFGGQDLETGVVFLNNNNNNNNNNTVDAAKVIDLPSLIKKGGDPSTTRGINSQNRGIDIKSIALHFQINNSKRADDVDASGLHVSYNTDPSPLSLTATHVGAKLISDHLPVVIEFNLP